MNWTLRISLVCTQHREPSQQQAGHDPLSPHTHTHTHTLSLSLSLSLFLCLSLSCTQTHSVPSHTSRTGTCTRTQHGQPRQQQARHDHVDDVVESAPAQIDGEGHIRERLGAARVRDDVASRLGGDQVPAAVHRVLPRVQVSGLVQVHLGRETAG